jgi:cytochrome b pre-mRNA-processing protein 3
LPLAKRASQGNGWAFVIPVNKELEKPRVLDRFRRRGQDRLRAIDLYGAIVAQARQPAFFEALRVQDTPEGRTSLLILFLFPVLERLQKGDARSRRTARFLTETFVTDIDDCLREMGVGDLAVPRKVKRAAQALGERCLAYRRAAASAEPEAALARELASTVPGLDAEEGPAARALAVMIVERLAAFSAAPAEALAARDLTFSVPSDPVANPPAFAHRS